MKVNILEAHDRFLHLKKQDFGIDECIENLVKSRPFGDNAFYIFAHTRLDENMIDQNLIWQPRLTRPRPQTNSMLFKAYPLTGEVRIIWILPKKELFGQFKKGNVVESEVAVWSIDMFLNHFDKLSENEPDDLSDEAIDQIYRTISRSCQREKGVIGVGVGMILPESFK